MLKDCLPEDKKHSKTCQEERESASSKREDGKARELKLISLDLIPR